jgi:hypothetical protein
MWVADTACTLVNSNPFVLGRRRWSLRRATNTLSPSVTLPVHIKIQRLSGEGRAIMFSNRGLRKNSLVLPDDIFSRLTPGVVW